MGDGERDCEIKNSDWSNVPACLFITVSKGEKVRKRPNARERVDMRVQAKVLLHCTVSRNGFGDIVAG